MYANHSPKFYYKVIDLNQAEVTSRKFEMNTILYDTIRYFKHDANKLNISCIIGTKILPGKIAQNSLYDRP